MDDPEVNKKLRESQSPEDDAPERHPFLCSVRCRITLQLFLISVLLYLHRVNLSLAIVCMVEGYDQREPRPQLTNSSHSSKTSTFLTTTDAAPTRHDNISSVYETVSKLNGTTLLQDDGVVVAQEKTLGDKMNRLPWDKAEVAILLSMYFYGCVSTQIPSGVVANKVGHKRLISIALIITGACSLLVPVCARTSIYLVFVLRLLLGMAGGTIIPVGFALLTLWAPPEDRAFMIGFTATGALVGSIFSYVTSGLLCEYGFDGGWPSIFYIHGILAAVSLCLWLYDAASRPSEHPRISKEELRYLNATVIHSTEKKLKTPWRSVLTSKALWAVFFAHCTFNWSFFMMLINGPMFLKEVLKFNVKENGVFSALPYVCTMISILVSGKMSNIVDQKVTTPLITRRVFTAISLLGPSACMIATGYMTSQLRYVAVALMCIGSCFSGLAWGGFFINHPEFAGRYAGVAMGITNTGGIVMALLASMAAGLLTPNSTQSEWQRVFYISAGFSVLGMAVYTVFSSTSLEPWAAESSSLEMTAKTKFIPASNNTKDELNTGSTNA